MSPTKRAVFHRCAGLLALTCLSPIAHAAWNQTESQPTITIHMDNGVTYFSGTFTLSGNCQNNRLQLDDTGDYFGSVENARRMYALILLAQSQGMSVTLGYNDADGPACRVAEVWIG